MTLANFSKTIVINRVVKHSAYWLVFVLFFTVVWGTYDHDYLRNFMIQLFSLPARLILVYGTLGVLFPIFFLEKKYVKFIVGFILLLIGTTILIQRPLAVYFIQPLYLQGFTNTDFFVVTELMNTVLDVHIAVIFPLGYVFFRHWQGTVQKSTELENKQHQLDRANDTIHLKVEKAIYKIFVRDIILIESQKNYIKVTTKHGDILAYKSMSSIQNTLPNDKFLRVHRSYIVGINFIDSYSPSQLILKGNSVPIGRKYKNEVKEILGYF